LAIQEDLGISKVSEVRYTEALWTARVERKFFLHGSLRQSSATALQGNTNDDATTRAQDSGVTVVKVVLTFEFLENS
jgi:hypothetical protein